MESNQKKAQKLRTLTANAAVMALYIGLSFLTASMASGAIQLRLSESLNHLVVFNRKFMWGVIGGVVLFNLFFGFGPIDAVFGGLQTFLALGFTVLMKKIITNQKSLLLLNTLAFTCSMAMIAFVILASGSNSAGFWGTYATLAASEAIIMGFSAPVMYWVNQKLHLAQK